LINFFLPELHGEAAAASAPTENLMAMLLLHDINLWFTFCNRDVVRKTWEAVDRFGIADARFYPYWKDERAAYSAHENVKVSAYLKSGNEALLVVVNSSDIPVESGLTLRPEILELPFSGIAAEDMFSGEPVEMNNNTIGLHIESKNFRLIRLFAR